MTEIIGIFSKLHHLGVALLFVPRDNPGTMENVGGTVSYAKGLQRYPFPYGLGGKSRARSQLFRVTYPFPVPFRYPAPLSVWAYAGGDGRTLLTSLRSFSAHHIRNPLSLISRKNGQPSCHGPGRRLGGSHRETGDCNRNVHLNRTVAPLEKGMVIVHLNRWAKGIFKLPGRDPGSSLSVNPIACQDAQASVSSEMRKTPRIPFNIVNNELTILSGS